MTKLTIQSEGGERAAAPADAPPAAEPATPSAQLVQLAIKEEIIDDGQGRKLTLRKPSVLAQFRIVQAVGAEVAANQTYMQMVNPLIYLAAIDGDPIPLPMSLREVEALIQRLGDDGLNAVFGWYLANVVNPQLEAVQAEEAKARLKN